MKLRYTRAMITAAMENQLNEVEYHNHPIFGFAVPQSVPNVPVEVLNPRDTWSNKEEYDATANKLAKAFNANFEAYKSYANEEIMAGAPKVTTETVA